MTEQLDNPAGRLAAVLRKVRKAKDGTKAWDAWREALDASNAETLYLQVGRFVRLLDETRAAIAQLPESEDPAFLSAAFRALDKLPEQIRVHFSNSDVKVFKDAVPEDVVVRLEAASRALRRANGHSATLAEEDRDELLVEVRALIDAVLAHPDLPQSTKLFVIKLLRDVESALIGYQLGGFDDVASAVAAVAGSVVTVETEAQRGWLQQTVRRLWHATLARASGAKALAESASSVVDAIESVDRLTG